MSVFKKKKKRESLGEVTMASTSDISFLLLIFFIVSTIFAEEQGLIMILPPKKDPTAEITPVPESQLLRIKIHANNAITLNKRAVELNQVKNIVEARIEVKPKTVVILETHPDAHYGLMVACLDELKLANAKKLTLKTTKR